MLYYYHCAQAADTVLLLQPNNVKALFRRGVARAAFGMLDGAKVSVIIDVIVVHVHQQYMQLFTVYSIIRNTRSLNLGKAAEILGIAPN
jgi:hypothetical protein